MPARNGCLRICCTGFTLDQANAAKLAESFIPNGDGTFECRFWDRTTGDCTIYATRPDVCREYPGDELCSHCGLSVDQLEGAVR
jgi:Fe-S-cluster containining protein